MRSDRLETQKPTVLFIMGPTASGKTDLAINIAKKYPSRIISVDSAMIYRGMDIGTAKPSAEELQKAPHQLIDILDPHEQYSVAHFITDAVQEVATAQRHGELAILVGGTMLYHNALLNGIATLPSADPHNRALLESKAQSHGIASLHDELQQVDPVSAQRIHRNDPQRLIRALDVYYQTQQPLSQLQQQQPDAAVKSWYHFCLQLRPEPRTTLHERIAKRFDQMLADGLADEVSSILSLPEVSADSPALRSVGYRQVAAYIAGEIDYDEMRERGIIATRQFAKRQYTWLRSLPADLIINPYETDNLMNNVDDIIALLHQHF